VLEQLRDGVQLEGELLAAAGVTLLRQGEKNSWLEIVLTEGKNRHIRRLLEAFGIEVLRLMRVGIGPLQLGQLPKAGFRHLSSSEIAALAGINRP
jgi:23S rRNA pseudouridine2605 synthase